MTGQITWNNGNLADAKLFFFDSGMTMAVSSPQVEEFFMGCLRFRGTARAMDVAKIIQDQRPGIWSHSEPLGATQSHGLPS